MGRYSKHTGKFRKASGGAKPAQWLIGLLSALCLLLSAVVIGMLLYINFGSGKEPEETVPVGTPVVTTTPVDTTVAPTAPVVPESTVPETTEQVETTEETEATQATKPKQNTQTTKPNQQKPAVTEPAKTVLTLPYAIPGTTLTVQRVAPYDGIYMEDGSDGDVSGVAMMLLKNVGSQAVEYAEVIMQYDDKTLTFVVSALPAGSQVVVQAKNRASCASGDLTACTASVATRAQLGMASDKVSVVDNGNNSITVTNLTDASIATVRIFYKYYMKEEGTYVGGITYTSKISDLPAGASVTVSPTHFTSDSAKVVMVRTYDTDA